MGLSQSVARPHFPLPAPGTRSLSLGQIFMEPSARLESVAYFTDYFAKSRPEPAKRGIPYDVTLIAKRMIYILQRYSKQFDLNDYGFWSLNGHMLFLFFLYFIMLGL